VRFTRICDFDVCSESSVFDLFDIMLVHGWLPDAADAPTAAAVDGRTHAGCVARLAALRRSGPGAAADAAALSAFLRAGDAAGGVSPGGLTALLAGVPDRQLCVLYRGGQFHAAFKREDAFYLLLTDEPLGPDATPPAAVWEQLAEAHGDNPLIDAAFCACMGPGGEEPLRRPRVEREVAEEAEDDAAAAVGAAAAAPSGAEAASGAAGAAAGGASGAGGAAASSPASASAADAAAPAAAARLAAAYAASSGGRAAESAAGTARDHALALRLQETFEEQERAARKAVRQASSRLQLQQERGAGGEESAEVRALMMRIEERMGERCSVM
jgi:hypothetical protein